MIPAAFIQDLLARTDIVEVVGRYVRLKKGGVNFFGLCPFHSEKSPSLTVSPSKQFYHCFGCGAHGTAIGFLMEFSGMGFVEAVGDLAREAGLAVPQDERAAGVSIEQAKNRSSGLDALEQAVRYYKDQLRGSQRAIDYLRGRGLSGEIAGRFALGYAPEGWENLRRSFSPYPSQILIDTGLVIDKSEDTGPRKYYDRFRDRIMFPIRNQKGQTIGFGGRILDVGEPKYINSPETELFQKGHELYGLFEARQAIREAGYVFVTEGYMDVVALAQHGFPQSVAILGTACTEHHVRKLLRITDQVIFSFDGDAAGRRAARRALEAALAQLEDQHVARFLFLPEEHDPDSYIREHGADAFGTQIEQALPLSAFFMRCVTEGQDLTSAEGRAATLANARSPLQSMRPGALRLQLVRALAQTTQTTPSEIESLFELRKPITPAYRPPARAARQAPRSPRHRALILLLSHPGLIARLDAPARAALCDDGDELAPQLQALFDTAKLLPQDASFAALSEVLRARGAEFDPYIAQIVQDPQGTEAEIAAQELDDTVRRFRLQLISDRQNALVRTGMKEASERAQYQTLSQLKEQIKSQPRMLLDATDGLLNG